jgi:hypothetical protein
MTILFENADQPHRKKVVTNETGPRQAFRVRITPREGGQTRHQITDGPTSGCFSGLRWPPRGTAPSANSHNQRAINSQAFNQELEVNASGAGEGE